MAKARSAKNAAKCSPSGDRGPSSEASARPNSRQWCSLAWNISLAGWPPSKSVELLPFQRLAVRALRCWGFWLLKSGSPAPHEARTLLGASAGISRIRLLVKPTRAVPPKGDVPHRQPLDRAEALAKLGGCSGAVQMRTLSGGRVQSGSERGNRGDGVHRGSQRRRIRRRRAPATGRPCPGAAHFTQAATNTLELSFRRTRREWREDLMTLLGESWSWQRHAKEHLLHHCGSFPNFAMGHRGWSKEPSTRAESEDWNASTRCCVRHTGLQRRTVAKPKVKSEHPFRRRTTICKSRFVPRRNRPCKRNSQDREAKAQRPKMAGQN